MCSFFGKTSAILVTYKRPPLYFCSVSLLSSSTFPPFPTKQAAATSQDYLLVFIDSHLGLNAATPTSQPDIELKVKVKVKVPLSPAKGLLHFVILIILFGRAYGARITYIHTTVRRHEGIRQSSCSTLSLIQNRKSKGDFIRLYFLRAFLRFPYFTKRERTSWVYFFASPFHMNQKPHWKGFFSLFSYSKE